MGAILTIQPRESLQSRPEFVANLLDRITSRKAAVGIIGLGYVGLPLAGTFCKGGVSVTGFDIDEEKVSALMAGRSYIKHISNESVGEMLSGGLFRATTDFSKLADVDAIIICVPTPLTRYREPDLSYIEITAKAIAPHLRRGQIVILESTTYPGTTKEVLEPILEQSGLKAHVDFLVAFSPEREDPGNERYSTALIPKVVGADTPAALEVAQAFYSHAVKATVPVSSAAAAEAVKLTENIFRAVNIALVNELKVIYGAMGLDIWEIIEAAKTKPFGFMPFYPGPGLGGHCIPIDPFYLTWKAREHEIATRFIELAGEINSVMPRHVVRELADAMDARLRRSVNGARILVMGAAYKKNVDDMRESPALKLIELLQDRGAAVDYFDPFIPVIPPTREHARLTGMRSVEWSPEVISSYDAVLIATDHDNVDYAELVRHSKLVVDTRNATKAVTDHRDRIVKA